jgi:hypothetical protein
MLSRPREHKKDGSSQSELTHGRTSRPSRYPNRLPYVQAVITAHPPYSPTSETRH